MLVIKNIQNLWANFFFLKAQRKVLSVTWLWDGELWNETLLVDACLNTIPFLIIQAINNSETDIWTPAGYFTFFISVFMVFDMVSQFVFNMYKSGNNKKLYDSFSLFGCFWVFPIISPKDIEKPSGSSGSVRGDSGSGRSVSGVELTANPVHHNHHHQAPVGLEAIKEVLQTAGEELRKQVLILLLSESKDLRIASPLDSEDMQKLLLKAGYKKQI